jgi:hypothetical protein
MLCGDTVKNGVFSESEEDAIDAIVFRFNRHPISQAGRRGFDHLGVGKVNSLKLLFIPAVARH